MLYITLHNFMRYEFPIIYFQKGNLIFYAVKNLLIWDHNSYLDIVVSHKYKCRYDT